MPAQRQNNHNQSLRSNHRLAKAKNQTARASTSNKKTLTFSVSPDA
jgi:hypothetical protein